MRFIYHPRPANYHKPLKVPIELPEDVLGLLYNSTEARIIRVAHHTAAFDSGPLSLYWSSSTASRTLAQTDLQTIHICQTVSAL